MAVNSSKQFQIMIYNKTVDTVVINHDNIEGCTKMIKNALESGLLLKFDDDLIQNIKQYFIILQSISFGLIINSKIDGYFPLSVSQILKQETDNYFSYINIQNTNFCLKLIWQNPLILKQWMKDKRKWKLILILLMNMLQRYIHTTYISNELIDFIMTLMNTSIYWRRKQFVFLSNHSFANIFMIFLQHVYLNMSKTRKQPPSTLSNSFLNVTKLFYIYCRQNNNKLSIKSWMKQWRSVCKLEICLECKIKHKYINHFYVSWDKMTNNFLINIKNFKKMYDKSNFKIGQITNSQKKKIISKKYDIFSKLKLCGNINCTNDKKYDELKICKGCKMICYCSRHCQKVDWKNIHKKQCVKLYDKMNDYDWGLVC